jgi:uncharacterized damage-inducible protein DinB
MYHTMDEFLAEWTYESDSTQKIIDLLNDDSLSTRVNEGERSLGFLAWHIVLSVHEMMSRVGLEFNAPHHDVALPATASEIAQGYRQANKAFKEAIRAQWTDAELSLERYVWRNVVKCNYAQCISQTSNSSSWSINDIDATSGSFHDWRIRSVA